MKKIAFISLLFLSLIIFAGCAEDKYPPVESSEEEARVVISLKIEDKEYEVRYELYRALFLNRKSAVDDGNSQVWAGDDASHYIDEINDLIVNDAVEIFSMLHLASKIGFDPYSDKANYDVKEMFKADIESYGSAADLSDEEKYDAYLKYLKQINHNYSTADLLYRYSLATEAVSSYYRTEYEYSKDDVKSYYLSDDCARILQAYFQKGVKTYTAMEIYREKLIGISNELSLAAEIIGSSSANETDLIDSGVLSGIMVGKQSLSQRKYSSYINEIFSLSEGEMSDIISLENTNAQTDGYYLVYRLSKNDEHFETFYPAIANSYIDNIIGGILGGMENALDESKSFTEAYTQISHKDISMN